MSKVEQGTGKASATKKNKVDTDNLDLGGETPIERMDIVLPGQDEIGQGVGHINQQPLEGGVDTSASPQTYVNAPTEQNFAFNNASDANTPDINAPVSTNNANQSRSAQIQDVPSIDGVDAVQSTSAAPLAPELNSLSQENRADGADAQQGLSSTSQTTTASEDAGEINVAPVDIDFSNSEVAENASGGTVIATLSTVDANDTDTHTYEIVSDPSGYFEIVGDEIRVKDGADLDFETAPIHEISIQVTDSAGNTFTETMTIDLTDVNEYDVSSISDTDTSTNTISEGVSNGDSVGITASATDADGTNNTITYSLSDDAGGIFEIDASTGEVSIADASGIDYENASSHTIEVTATSADGSTSMQSYTIDVTDVDEFDVGAVSDSNASSNAVDENASVGDTVGITALASDGDVTDGVSYSLSDDAGGLFDIDANTGVVTVAGSLDAETSTSHTIEVTATSDDGSTSTQTFAIGVNDVNETSITAISDSDASGNTVTEGATVGTAVGITAFASDADTTDTVSYSLSSNPGGFFAIDANTGEVTVAGSLDYETDTSHTIEVTATSSDGTTSTQTFTIAVGDEDEHDVSAISDTDGSANTIAEDVSNGDSVGITASATDADGSNNTVTYSLSDDAGGIFEVDANTGEVSIADASGIDYENATSHTIEVTATSADGSTSTQSYTINVTDVDEFAVSDITYTGGSVNETVADGGTIDSSYDPSGATVATLSAVDGDGTDTFSYAITNDPSGHFEIVGNEVRVKSGQDIDFETAESHDITIEVTDAGGNTYSETITINVQDYEGTATGTSGADNMTGTSEEDVITGGGGADIIYGGNGDDFIYGRGGDDQLYGGDGNDTFQVGGGNSDYVDGGEGIDTINATGAHSVDINLETGSYQIAGQNNTVVDIENVDLKESTVDNTVVGSSENNLLETGSGVDTLTGGAGNDTLDGGAGTNDTAVYSGNWSDYTITESGGTYTIVDNRDGSPDGTDTVSNIENFEFADGTVGVADVLDVGPSDIDVSSDSVDENSASGTVVATLSATDNALDSHTYTITNDPSGLFEISSDQILVKAGADIDFEGATSHDVTIEVTDANGNTYSETITIDVNDLDEFDVGSISDTDGSANTIAEDVSNGDSVGITASATDADGSNNTVTYSLSDDAGGIFEVDANTGEVSIADASGIDYENATSHTIEVTATSADGSTSTQSYTINVTDIDEFDVSAVTDTDSATNTIAENASAGDEVGVTASATDADGTNNTVTYSVDDARFEVASDGTVTVASGVSFDAETEGSINIEVTATSADGSTSTETFSINVSDIDEFDVGAVSDSNASSNAVDENASVGDTVGITALASDGDVTDGVTYSLSDDAGGLFDIDANTGVVTVAGSLDAETSTSHTIEVTATSDDGSTSTQTFAIGVNDVNETSITAISDTDGTGNTVTEGASVGTAVGITALASDADATDTVSYSLSSNPGGFFAIDANTGEVTVAGSLDYETDTSHTIEVTATSTDGTTSTQTFTIAVGDEAENVQLADGGVTFTDTGVTETSVSGGAGDDDITGTSGDDVIAGNAGNDFVNAGAGNDKFDDSASGNGDDTVNMGAGDDYAYGGDGSDVIDGGTGEDFIHGEDGNDTLTGGADDDTIRGGDGIDIAVFSGDRADYTISHSESPYYDGGVWTVTGPDGTDTVMEIETFRFDDGDYSADDLQETADQTIVGTVNDDVLHGGSGNDTISGLSGDDVVNAGAGDDRFDDTSTGNGNDTLNMGEGNDTAYGGDGTDTINGDEGDDKLYGESGNDTITGGEGNDAIDGGTGDDTAVFSGNWADYTITESGGTYTVVDNRPGSPDGTDTVKNVEFFEFADGTTTADDVIDVGPSDIDLSATSIDENSSAGTVVATLSAEDNSLDVQSYTITSDPSGFFEISGDQVVVKAGADIDFENATSHDITIEVSDGAGSTYTETITINVSDIDEFDVGAVTDTDSATNTIAENASAGDEIGVTASATDADGTNNTVTYSVDDARFEVASDGTVTVASGASFDAETEGSIDIAVTATSADGSSSTETFSINVADIDEFDVGSISDTDGSANTIAEDVSNGDSVGITASATDADGSNNTVTYSLSDDAGGIFEIDANTGEVSILDASGIDYENATSHTIEVTATSADGSTSTQSYTINVSDIDEFDVGAVTDTDSATNTIAENASAGDEVGVTASATDADGTNNTVTYSVDDARFEVASDGTVTVASGASFDAETEGSIDIAVTATSADGSTSTETFSITVSDFDEFDVGAVSDNNASSNAVDENATVGDTVGITALASDGDVTDSVSYSLSDDAGGLFDIDANTGVVTVAGSLDAETSTSHTIEVTATSDDGSTSTQTFAIGVNDVNETSITAISDSDASGNTVTEGATVGTAVGITAFASDADATDTVSYSLSSNPGGFFAIDANTGEVTVAGSLDYETDTSHTIEVTATSTDGTTSTQTFTIALGDENEGPTDISFTGGTVDETVSSGGTIGSSNDPSGTTVATLSATDEDSGETFTFAITNDLSGHYEIVGNEVRVKSGQEIDYETAQTHDITIEVTDADGNTYSETITINVEDYEGSASGTSGHEFFQGTSEEDQIKAGEGHDTILGGDGDDSISAGDGNDAIIGGTGADAIDGGDGEDTARYDGSSSGVSVSLSSGTGSGGDAEGDTLKNVENLQGSSYSDKLVGDAGDNTIDGMSGDDYISGEGGADTLDGGSGSDEIDGGAGADTIYGGSGDDNLDGGADNDVLQGDSGNDTIDGGDGEDTAVYTGNWADYTITESAGTYKIVDNRPGSPDGTDTVTNVEDFEFADGTVAVADLLNVGPTDIDVSSSSVDENSASGTVVATLSTTDNALDTHTYSITKDPSGLFEISGDQIVVKAGADIDYENATSHDILVEVTDAAGKTYSETITINVTDVDEFDVGAVTDTDSATNTIAENASAGDEVGVTASATDADGTNNTVTYSVDDARFEVASDGTVTVASGASFDAETEGSIDIEVTATSADGSTSTETFSITVSDFDEFDVGAVFDNNASSNAVDENATVGDTVGITALASDGDVTDSVSYSLSDDAGGLFDIDANTGVVTVAGSLDAETSTSHTIEVTATSDDGSTSTQTFAIGVNDVNETSITAISDSDASGNTVTEGATVGTAVGITAFASDADATDTVSYSLSSNPGGFFAIDANTGEVTVAGSLDYETDTSHTIEVTATSSDGTTSTQTFTIAVGDEDEHDVGNISDTDTSANSVDENAAAGTTVGIVASATDADATNSDVTYSLSDDAGGLFTIDATTGEVTTTEALDAETASSYDIEVTATSEDGSTSTTTFTVDVNNLMDEGPTDITFTGGTVNETVLDGGTIDSAYDPSGSTVATLSATDADAGDSFTYNITSDPSGHFEIVGNEVRVKSGQDIDFETAETHDITIEVTDAGGNSYSETITINVQDFEGAYTATSAGETITGTREEDVIDAHADGSTIDGGWGSDTINGSASDDDITGNRGHDTINAGDGNDVIDGGDGDDLIFGGDGDDIIEAGEEINYGDDDVIYGGAGNDTITSVETDSGSNDTFYGEAGDDTIISQGGADILDGGTGDDRLSGGTGDDTIDGGDDTDTAVYSGNWSDYTITENAGTYTIVDNRSGSPDGTDTVTNVENFEFADGTVAVADLLDVGPSDIDVSSNSVDENSASGTVVATLSTTDNALDSHSYEITNDPSGFFEVSGDQIVVKAGANLDTENAPTHDITVEVTDSGGNTYSETITINVTDIDEFDVSSISDTDTSANSVDENAAAGTTVGIVASATDADATNSDMTYSLSDDAGGLFTIDTTTGEVTTTAALDAETASSYDIEVTATSEDGSTSTTTFTVDVNNLMDEGPTDISFGMDNLVVNGSFEDFVASSSNVYGSNSNDVEGWTAEHGGVIEMHVDGYGGTDATDGNYWMDGGTNADNAHISQVIDGANDGISYNLTFDAADRSGSGEMEIYWGGELVATIDPETATMESYSIDVIGGAGDGTNTLEFKEVGNVDNSGVALDNIQLVQNAVVENAAEGTIVATLSAEDADAGDSFTYAITSDPSGNFEISGNQIVVKAGADIDYEDATSHDVTVEVTDAGGNTYSETVTVNVADVNEAPTDITFSGNSDLDITGGNPTSVDAVVTGEIVSNGSNSSIDHFEISHNGGELTIDGLADGLNGGDLDMQFELLRDNGDGTYTSVGYNDDGASGSDGSTSYLDSYLNFSDLEAGDYLLAVGNINFDQTDVENTSSDYPTGYWNGSSETGEYQVTISGDATVAIAQNPDFGGTWGDPQNNISIVNDGSSPATIAAGSVIGAAESVADVDASDTFTYALADDADGKYEIDADTGEIKLVAEHDASSAYSDTVDVQVTDSGGNTYTETVGIQLGTADAETLTGTSNSDIMHGFGGQDTLNGGDGDDVLVASDMSLDGGEITGSNLITNGGFENTSSGWTLNSGPGFQFYSDGDRSVNTTEGSYYLDMDEAPGNIAIEQTVSDLTTGTSYQLSFDTAATGGYDASVEVYWNGELIDTVTSDSTTMSSNTFTVVGGSGDGSDIIEFVEVGAVDYGGTALDNVQLFEISEPTGDTLNGGDGDDIMISATGSDTIDGGAGTDTVSYEGSDSAVNVNLNTDTLSGGDAEGDTLTSIENVTGSDHEDTLTGDSAANTLVGGDGNDTLDGGSGKDTLDGGAGDDILMAGFDDGTGDIFIGGEGNDTYQIEGTNVENHAFNIDLNTGSDQYDNSYSGIENINGGNGDDTFTGDANANTFSGGAGDDTMYGGDESDIFVFGEGDGADTVHGGAGGGWTDTIELTDAGGDLGTYGTDWTVSLTSGSIDAQDANSLTLSDDADGTITLADGSTVDFFEIERIEF